VRTMIMIPIVIALTRSLGWDPVSFALPAALTIDWVVGLPISGKPNVILFSTNQYSVTDNFKYGIVTCTLGLVILVGSAATWFHWLGVTPEFWATAPAMHEARGAPDAQVGQGTRDTQDVRVVLSADGSGAATITTSFAANAGAMSIPTGFTAAGPVRLTRGPAGATVSAELRGGQTHVRVLTPPGTPSPAVLTIDMPVAGVLTTPTPAGRSFRFSMLQTQGDAIRNYRLAVTFPDGMRALAIREALPKVRTSEIVPRAVLDTIDGRVGARLRVDNVQQGERVSLQIELARAMPPWGWLVAGLGLAAMYLWSFRDLVKRTS